MVNLKHGSVLMVITKSLVLMCLKVPLKFPLLNQFKRLLLL